MKKPLINFLLALACIIALSAPASAEWFADLYVGPSFTQSEDVVISQPGFKATLKDVEFANSVSFGGRLGYWFESTPYIGFALDASHFRPDMKKQQVTGCFSGPAAVDFGINGCDPANPLSLVRIDLAVTGISFDALLRWPLLTSKEFPKGKLQPYLTVGPTIFVARAKDTSKNSSLSPNFIPPGQSETDTSVVVKAGTGIAWQFHQNVALFGEYRFTHFAPKFDFKNLDAITGVGTVSFPMKTDINTHRAVFGISLRY